MKEINNIHDRSLSYTDNAYINFIESIASDYKNGRLILFCGAGISMESPSQSIGAEKLVGGLLKAVETSLQIVPNLNKEEINKIITELGTFPLELFLDAFAKTFGLKETLSYLKPIDIDIINTNHYYISLLATNNLENLQIVTLNFDTLIERSIYQILPCEVFCPLIDKESQQRSKEKYTIIKPHGSFPLPGSEDETHVGLTTTLSEIKDKPNLRTVQVINKLFEKTASIVFVGYGGEDWDILPIFNSLFDKINHVYWINHHTRVEGIIAKDGNDPKIPVQQFLSKMGEKAYIIHRNTKEVLHDIVMGIGLPLNDKTIKEIENRKAPKVEISHQSFIKDSQAKYAVLVGINTLLENGHMEIIGEILSFLDQEFENQNEIQKNPFLYQAFCNYAGWYCYLGQDFRNCFRYRHKALKINKPMSNQSYSKEYINTLLSTGYEYISYAKPHCLVSPARIIKAPYYLMKGYHYLSVSVKITQEESVKAAAEYYKVDFWHNWAYLFMIFNTKVFSFLRCCAFSKILSRYERISQIDSEYMQREYFYLRMIEATILAGKPLSNKEEIARIILDITNYFLRIKHFGHLRNVLITRAFIAYDCNNTRQKEIAKRYFELAKLDKNNIKNALSVDEINDACISAVYDFVNFSSEKRTLTTSAIMRYEIFGAFFNDHPISLQKLCHYYRYYRYQEELSHFPQKPAF